MKNKHVGLLVVGIAIIFFFVVMSFNNALETIVEQTCTHGEACPMHVTVNTQKMISYSLIGLIVIMGLVITFFMKEEKINSQNEKKEFSKHEKVKKLENLDVKEKIIMNIILRENGSVYQSDIVRETKQSKVKITRILDQLEGKGLIERKRRGMTNIVVLK